MWFIRNSSTWNCVTSAIGVSLPIWASTIGLLMPAPILAVIKASSRLYCSGVRIVFSVWPSGSIIFSCIAFSESGLAMTSHFSSP